MCSKMESPFQKFYTLIRSLNLNDDSIVLDRKLKYLADDIIEELEGDEHILWDALLFFNECALEDSDFGTNFALLFASRHFDKLKRHLQSSDGNCIFRAHILNMLQKNYSDAENLKEKKMEYFYNSVSLLGEFYSRLHQKTRPILIMGKSLLEILTKHVQKELTNCKNDIVHVFDVRFARLILAQITLNGSTARQDHQAEIDKLFFEIRKCMIELPNLASVTKAFMLMTLDLYYSDFTSIGTALENFYGNILDEHDNNEKMIKMATNAEVQSNDQADDASLNRGFSLCNLRKDIADLNTAGFKTNGSSNSAPHETNRVNKEYLNRPLKASERLKFFQKSSNQMQHSKSDNQYQQYENDDNESDAVKKSLLSSCSSLNANDRTHANECDQHASSQDDLDRSARVNNNASYESVSSENNSFVSQSADNNIKVPSPSSSRSPLLSVSTNCQDSTKSENVTSPIRFDKSFNWFEAVENVTNDLMSNCSFNKTGGDSSTKFDNLSVVSCSSNPVSPKERTSPKSFNNNNRSRRNSLNRFRSEFYKQSNEDLHQNFDKRSNHGGSSGGGAGRSQNQLNYQPQSWRSSGHHTPRNESRNGIHKRTGGGVSDFEHDGAHDLRQDSNPFRRNLSRGGSVDSNIKDVYHGKQRHDSYNRRNQENDFENFQSYTRKPHARSKDIFVNNNRLPPRLQQAQQQKLQQQKMQQQHHQQHQHQQQQHPQHQHPQHPQHPQQQKPQFSNESENGKRFTNRNNQQMTISASVNNNTKEKFVPKPFIGGNNSTTNNPTGHRDNKF